MRKLSFGSITSHDAYEEAITLLDTNINTKEYKVNCIEIDPPFLQQLLTEHQSRLSSMSFLIEPSEETKQLLAQFKIPYIVKFNPESLEDLSDEDLFPKIQSFTKALEYFGSSPSSLLSYLLAAKSKRHPGFNGSLVKLNRAIDDTYELTDPLQDIYSGRAPRSQFILQLADRKHWFAMDVMLNRAKLSIIILEPAFDPGILAELAFLKHALNDNNIPHTVYLITPMIQYDKIHCGFYSYIILGETAKLPHDQLTKRLASKIPDYLTKSSYYRIEKLQLLCRNIIWLHENNLPEKCVYFTQSYSSMEEKLIQRGQSAEDAKKIVTAKKIQFGEDNSYLIRRCVNRADTLTNPKVVEALIKYRIMGHTTTNPLLQAFHDYGFLTEALIKNLCVKLSGEQQLELILTTGKVILAMHRRLLPNEPQNFYKFFAILNTLVALRTVLLQIVETESYTFHNRHPLINERIQDHNYSVDPSYTNFEIAVLVAMHGGRNEEYLEELRFREKLHKTYPIPYLKMLYNTFTGVDIESYSNIPIALAMSYLTPQEADDIMTMYPPKNLPFALNSMAKSIKSLLRNDSDDCTDSFSESGNESYETMDEIVSNVRRVP